MQKPFGFFRLFVICSIGTLAAQANAASPSFTVTATNVTMPANGNSATSRFTLTSVNGYSGRLVVNSQYAGGDMNAKPPTCGQGTAVLFTLNANSTVSGALTCSRFGTAVPAVQLHHPAAAPNSAPVLALAVAGWFLFGRRWRTNTARWFAVVLLSVLSLAAIGGCGGNGLSGTYPFTVTATDAVTNATASTSIMVTVP